ncbi:hypothetical protein RND81_09G139600 [Saponaria officinalis]|uniref:Uncharacterized protein n=1 Tax=Saponaria officinalis TaxID=3572 RepID=A0AAW1ILH7_SAPOF
MAASSTLFPDPNFLLPLPPYYVTNNNSTFFDSNSNYYPLMSNPGSTSSSRKRPASEMENTSDIGYVYGHDTDSNMNLNNQSELPLVCGFSGLPLFPPVGNSNTHGNTGLSRSVHGPVSGGNSVSVDDPTWVDGIIKDLIQSSNSVSIPQLIQNVRDIIYPCNPNLGSVIEFRLRSLSDPLPVSPLIHPDNQPQPQPQPPHQPLQQNISENVSWNNANISAHKTVVVEKSVSPPAPSPPPTPTPPPPAVAKAAEKEEQRRRKRDEEGLHLLTLLLQCAEAISTNHYDSANRMLVEISEWATPFGTSAQRVAAYFSEAMSARLVSTRLGLHSSLPSVPHYQKLVSAFQVFNGISPFVKFSHFTANQAIQEAFQREERVHIIDLDIMQGLQWPGLFHILASRPGGPPYVRLTGLGSSTEALEATGKRLSDFAEKLGLQFEFVGVAEKIGKLDLEKLHVSKREAVAVHWLQHSLYDVTGSDMNTLWLLQSAESGDNSRTRPKQNRRLFRPIRGSGPLLLRPLRFPRSKLQRGQRRATCCGTATPL